MKNTFGNVSYLLRAVVFAVAAAGAGTVAHAQVDVRNGVCEDSTCARRDLSMSNSPSYNTSTMSTSGAGACQPSTVDNAPVACPSGMSGTMHSSTATSCPNGPSGASQTDVTGYDMSACIPNSTVITAPEPPPTPAATCPSNNSENEPLGTILDRCEVQGVSHTQHPKGQTYKCTTSGWIESYPGSSKYMEVCS